MNESNFYIIIFSFIIKQNSQNKILFFLRKLYFFVIKKSSSKFSLIKNNDVGKSFKEILFAKKPEDLESWIEECQLLGIEELDRFVNGIQRDKDAVKNAIQFDYNNGLAEGSINKLKVIKRIMYGRSSFELLKSKLLRLELKRKIN